jgi:3-dehydroquinate synthase
MGVNMATFQGSKLNINIPSTIDITYPIFIGADVLKLSGKLIKEYIPATKLLLVTNDTIFPIYGNTVVCSLRDASFDVKTAVIPDGEDYKNFGWFKVILDKAVDFNLERNDAIIALGGGVIGDMVGYAAASYLRGIDLVQLGTTLLAQVDSSIGGKVGINHPKGKNLIGAFYQPKCVVNDVNTLKTLDRRNLKNGLGEVLKYAFIEKTCNYRGKSINLFNYLNDNKENIYRLNSEVITEIVSYCCKLKAAVVEQDEKEAGLRAILNLGHTTGHALEVCGGYQLLSHGEAVSIGTIAAIRLAKNKGLMDAEFCDQAENLINYFELPSMIPQEIEIKSILRAMKLDKKVLKNKIRFILPVNTIGKVEIFDNIDEDLITSVLETMYT